MAEGSTREWSGDIKNIGDQIMALTLLKAQELGDYLQDVYGIEAAAAPVVAVGAAGSAGASAGQAEPEKEEFTVVLTAAGVKIIFADGQSQTHNARNITQSAGNAVANGLSRDAALRAITLAPAEVFGVADRVGSIEVGKEADVVIWPADPLELTSYPEQVFIKGNAVEMTSRQTLLRDRYLQMNSDKPPAYRK